MFSGQRPLTAVCSFPRHPRASWPRGLPVEGLLMTSWCRRCWDPMNRTDVHHLINYLHYMTLRLCNLTHRGRITDICARKLEHHWFRKRLTAPVHCHNLDQCWLIVSWTHGYKLKQERLKRRNTLGCPDQYAAQNNKYARPPIPSQPPTQKVFFQWHTQYRGPSARL